MLSVGGSGARSRSKSPGRRDDRERSRTRDIRAPSPARRAPSPAVAPPPTSRSKKYYEEEDSDDSLVSDSEDRRRAGYARGADRALVRGKYDDDEDDDEDDYEDKRKYASRYAENEKHRYAAEDDLKEKAYRRDDKRREQPRTKEYAIPGQFEDDEDSRPSNRQERPNGQGRTASYTMNNSQYEKLPQFQYAAVDPKEVRYVQNNKAPYTRTPSNDGPVYTRNPGAQVTVASSRHGRQPSYEDRDARDRSDKYGRDERHGMSRRDIERLEKEKDELRRQEDLRRQLDILKREKEEREEKELKQKRPKNVQIRDDRDRDREREKVRDRDYHEIKPKHDRRDDKYADEIDRDRRRGGRPETDDRRRDDTRRAYDDDDSDDSDEDERLDKLYHAKYREDERYDDQYDDRRDDRRRDKDDRAKERPANRHRESDEKRGKPQVVEIHPGGRGAPPTSSGLVERARGLSVSGHKSGALTLAAPGSGGHVRRGSVGAPPGSPLLESYRGTYQSISPMPSPMALAHHPDDSDLSDLELAVARRKKRRSSEETDSSDEDDRERKPKSILRRAREVGLSNYDPEHDATILARELKGPNPSPDVLIKVLPTLSNENISLLRTEYKKHAKIQGKGINIAKHIKLKAGGTNLGKAAYAVALGRWESEAHWANFWYQSGSSRRELLIECLFGRSNDEIKAIKDAFTDKRYGDSLTKCMESELKKDKFRVAVLKALEAKRDEHRDISMKAVDKDVIELHKALTSKDGGETAMLTIIITRSDEHLRMILQEYERTYRQNFARDMVKRSQNLVGETLAHILNGVINRPVRDALLLHQAIAETSKDRAELIISRLVRLHWEPKHLARVKVEYANRYPAPLEHDIEDGTKGDFSTFCVALCRGAVR